MPKMRLGWYAGVSTALASSVVLSAFHQRSNFYSAMVYLSQSNFCLLVMLNFTLLLYSGFLWSLVRLCFGRLRAIEVEQLTERAWFAITETCLAMTIFREEIGAWFIVMFTALVTGKIWGWIADGRVEILEQQPPANPRLFHIRLCVSLLFGFIYDIALFRYIFNTVLQQARPNMMVMFLFEFALLDVSLSRTMLRYGLSLAEQTIIKRQTQQRLTERKREVREQRERMVREREQAAAANEETAADQEALPNEDDVDEMDIEVPGWAAKGELVLWLDLLIDMIRLCIYVGFFFMLLAFYGLPIHIIRDLFMTCRDFLKRLSAVLRYRKAMAEMNRHPDATAEELAENNTCIICREDMNPWDPNVGGAVERNRPKKLPCGHTLHLGCLKSWLERQQVCPTCRTPVTSDRARPAAGGNNGNRAINLRIGVGNQPQAPAQAQQAPANGANNAAAFPPAGQPNHHNQQHQQPQPQQPPANDHNRPRVFQLGPIRFGLARGGDQIRELGQRMGMNMPAGNNAAPMPVAPVQEPTPASQQQQPQTDDNLHAARNHLQLAEMALMSEITSLQTRQIQLQSAQLLMTELQLIRQRHGLPEFNSPLAPMPGAAPMGPVPALNPQLMGMSGLGNASGVPPRINSPILGRHGASNYTTSIPSGSSDLPEGVVIPQGWSLMPLERYNGQGARQPSPGPGHGPASSAEGAAPSETEATPRSAEPQSAEPQSVEAAASNTLDGAATPPRPNVPDGPTVISPSPVAPTWNFNSSSRLFPETASTTDSSPTRSQNNDHTPSETESTSQSAAPSSSHAAASSSYGTAPSTTSETTLADKGKAKAATVEDEDDESSDSSSGDV